MFGRSLKTNIVVSITLLLFIGMALIDFVAIRTMQRDLIASKISQGYLAVSILEDIILEGLSHNTQHLLTDLKPRFATILSRRGFTRILLKDAQHRTLYAAGKNRQNTIEIDKLMRAVQSSGKRQTEFSGSTWGVFWKQRREILLASPIWFEGRTHGSIGLVINLEGLYRQQRKSQSFILLYLIVNILVLALIGFYRLSRLYLEPINRLVTLAEDYQDTDGTFFPVRKEDNELSTLSKALNVMLSRISDDRQKLRLSVNSLEKTNMELKKAQAEIIRAEKLASIGRLSSGIAHEIGNPIGIVMGYLELIKQEDTNDDEKREYIQRTESEINRINTVIQQLLDFSRPSSQDSKRVSVHDVIHEISEMLQVQPLMAGVDLKCSLQAGNDGVTADPEQLRQVFLNLAINAADAVGSLESKQDGILHITTENPGKLRSDGGGTLKIAFRDNGPGIPDELIANIFDPFFTTKDPGKGTGLGLSVSFMIIESFGGTISAENVAESGASLTIQLPLAD